MNRDFDPYEILMEAMERITRMEQAHNNLATAFHTSEKELTIALHSIKHLQQQYLLMLSNQVKADNFNQG